MKIKYMSDLHLEFGTMPIPLAGDADVLVLAGDIGVGSDAVDWINEAASMYKDVIYVMGNHEFYHNDIGALYAYLRRPGILEVNVHLLNNHSITIDGVKFAATTLWTDMTEYAFRNMNDSRVIRTFGQRLLLGEVKNIHKESKEFLHRNSDSDVFITHHCPDIDCINTARYGLNDPISAGYYTSILGEFEGTNVKHWICGHTHNVTEFEKFGINVHMNCRGYKSYEEVNGFDPNKMIEVFPSHKGD